MLVVSRRIHESLMIGKDITLLVTDIDGTQIKLGIKAPRSIEVAREEIADRIHEQKRLTAPR